MEYQLCPSILAADFWRLGEEIDEVKKRALNGCILTLWTGGLFPPYRWGPGGSLSEKIYESVFRRTHYGRRTGSSDTGFCSGRRGYDYCFTEKPVFIWTDIGLIHEQGCKAGVAINPATPLSMLENILELADMILIMTVNPGFGGQKYIDYCTEKVRRLRKMAEEREISLDIQVDGGINRETIHTVLDAGANVIVAGSAVFGGDIRENVNILKGIIEEYEDSAGMRR